jgi:hypothetical protein
LVALAFAAQALLPASSSADVGPDGWGISDDYHTSYLSLNASFDELAPNTFRLIAAWDRLSDPAYLSQMQARIKEANAAARKPGGMEIAVSFSVPPQTWGGVPLTGQAWLDQVTPFITRFTPDVEWWSPMNEPGLKGWTFTPSGAAAVADFSVRLKNYLQQNHPADRQLSPDFNDHYNTDGTLKRHPDGTSFVDRYVKLFDKAGGEFGSMVSWHVHGAVKYKSVLGTDDLVTTLAATKGASLPIWVTEAGAHVNDTRAPGQTEAQQDDQVKWLVDTSTGLASHDRITRMSYYHMRQETDVNASTCQPVANFPWDTALQTACAQRRPAWYTWCLAARQKDAACYDDSVGAAAWNPFRLDVLYRGNGDDAAVYGKWWDGTKWSSGTLGGATLATPALIAPADQRLEMYIRGGDNAIWHRRWDGTVWSGWSTVGGLTYASPAASARRGTSIVDVFIRGSDNAIYHRFRNGNTWSPGWSSIGAPPGGATSAPAAVSNSTGKIDVFVRGADFTIWRRSWTTSWGAWTSVGSGAASSSPAVTSRGTNRLDLFMRGTDGQVYHRYNDGGGWSGWDPLGGAMVSAPAAVAASSKRIDVWARGAGNAIQHKTWQAGVGWSGWSSTWFPGPR